MTMQQTVQSIPRTIVRTYVDAARLPLGLAESILRRGETSGNWAPALAFEAVEASVKQVIGSFLRDPELIEEGRLIQAKVAQLRKAAELETLADQQKAQADAEYQQRKQADEATRAKVAQQAEQRERALDQEKARRKQEVAEAANKKAATARKIEAEQQKAVDRQERAARTAELTAEQKALADERKAAAASENVLDLDRALRTTKAARKAR